MKKNIISILAALLLSISLAYASDAAGMTANNAVWDIGAGTTVMSNGAYWDIPTSEVKGNVVNIFSSHHLYEFVAVPSTVKYTDNNKHSTTSQGGFVFFNGKQGYFNKIDEETAGMSDDKDSVSVHFVRDDFVPDSNGKVFYNGKSGYFTNGFIKTMLPPTEVPAPEVSEISGFVVANPNGQDVFIPDPHGLQYHDGQAGYWTKTLISERELHKNPQITPVQQG